MFVLGLLVFTFSSVMAAAVLFLAFQAFERGYEEGYQQGRWVRDEAAGAIRFDRGGVA